MACEKEEHLVNKNNEQLPQNPKDTVQNKFIFQWDTLIDDSKNDDEFFIGNQYIGVQRWECLATPPHIYVGATFPKSSFATTFDRENIDKKHPMYLQPIITQYFIDNKSEIWLLFLIAHSKR